MKENKLKSFFLLNKVITILLLSIYVLTIVVVTIYFYLIRTRENMVIDYPSCPVCLYEVKYDIARKIDYRIPDILGYEKSESDGFNYRPFYDYRYNSFQYSYFLNIYILSITVLLILSILTVYSYKKIYIKNNGTYYVRIFNILAGLISVFIPFYTLFYLSELSRGIINFYIPGYFTFIITGIISIIVILLETLHIIMVLRKDVRKYYGLLK